MLSSVENLFFKKKSFTRFALQSECCNFNQVMWLLSSVIIKSSYWKPPIKAMNPFCYYSKDFTYLLACESMIFVPSSAKCFMFHDNKKFSDFHQRLFKRHLPSSIQLTCHISWQIAIHGIIQGVAKIFIRTLIWFTKIFLGFFYSK